MLNNLSVIFIGLLSKFKCSASNILELFSVNKYVGTRKYMQLTSKEKYYIKMQASLPSFRLYSYYKDNIYPWKVIYTSM